MKRRTWSERAVAVLSIATQWGSPPGNSRHRSPRARFPSAAELLAQQLVELRRIGLAAGRLHDLANEKAEQLVLAGTVIGQLSRVACHRLIDRLLDGGAVGD